MGTRKERTSMTDSFRLEIQGFPMRKQERKHERGRPSGIEGARRLRIDVDYLALFSQSGGFCWGPQKHLAGCYGAVNRAREEWGIRNGTDAILDENRLADVMGSSARVCTQKTG